MQQINSKERQKLLEIGLSKYEVLSQILGDLGHMEEELAVIVSLN
jgi:hypothetical protein